MANDKASSGADSGSRRVEPIALGVVPHGKHPAVWLPRILALVLLGMASTAVWMTRPDLTERVGDLDDHPQWVTWVTVLAIQSGIFLAVLPAVIKETWRPKLKFKGTPAATFFVVLALLILPWGVDLLFEQSHPVQTSLGGRITPILVIGTAVATITAAGVVRVHKEIDVRTQGTIARSPATSAGDADDEVKEFSDLRRRLRLLGGILALLVALAVLSAGAQRNAIVAMETARAAEETAAAEFDADKKSEHLERAFAATAAATRFGVDIVWSYGLYYSFVLVLIYLPPYLSLMGLGRAIRDKYEPRALPSDPGYEANKKVRDAWDDVLSLKVSAAESLRAATLVLIPLVTSLASTILGGVEVSA